MRFLNVWAMLEGALRARILLIGAGQMGGAMLKGWLKAGVAAPSITVLEPHPSSSLQELTQVHGVKLNPQDFPKPDLFVLAIKPQMAGELLPAYSDKIADNTLFLSIMAGKTTQNIAHFFNEKQPIVRAMPNTPSSVGRGITGAFANAYVQAAQKEIAHQLLLSLGQVEWVAREDLIDVVTAVSGSGPAYLFHLVEALARAGEMQGLPADLALRLARATVEGAGEMLWQNQTISPAQLRENVTSPNGTTFAALQALMPQLTPLMAQVVAAATQRSQELAG